MTSVDVICTIAWCSAFYCIAGYSVEYCIVLYFIVHCLKTYCIVWCCIVWYGMAWSCIHCIVLYCTLYSVFGLIVGHLRAILAQSGSDAGPSWGHLGAPQGLLGAPTLGTMLGLRGLPSLQFVTIGDGHTSMYLVPLAWQ